TTWNRECYRCAISWTTRDFEQPANSCGPFPHACQTPVSRTSFVEHLRVDSASIVANPHARTLEKTQSRNRARCGGPALVFTPQSDITPPPPQTSSLSSPN